MVVAAAQNFFLSRPWAALKKLSLEGRNKQSFLAQIKLFGRHQAGSFGPTWFFNHLDFKNSLNAWPWPKSVVVSAQRKGDVQGVEIKFFVKNPGDLEKTLQGLHGVASTWKTQDDSDRPL